MKCQKNIDSKNPKVVRTKCERIMLLSNCAVCDSKKSKFIKHQEVSGLLISLGIKIPLREIPLVGHLFFNSIKQVNRRYKMNERVNTFFISRR